MTLSLLPIDAASYQQDPLHRSDRVWTETNCYVDVWIELLHALGLDPLACAAFPISTDFEVGQWTFFKFPPEDLRAAYGIDVFEMNAWRPIIEHVAEELARGRLLTVEVDSWFLPDTRGVSYQIAHVKSTIVAQMLDVDARRLGYFHNAGYFELSGDDFDGVFRLGQHANPEGLPPYVEIIRLDRLRRKDPEQQLRSTVELLRTHLSRLPTTNPMYRFHSRLESDIDWLRSHGIEGFHAYAFGTCRQCGASAELAASFVEWLAAREPSGPGDLPKAAAAYRSIADRCKALEFGLARLARGRNIDLDGIFSQLATDWDDATTILTARYA
ncbi:uncharacterized protein DUF1839 [Antricoccus suffuscus]|uniref:Uncharacterized protein DUF1839 n=1 Tax=Antricoccus suffuscus TaxID=1629062 RepID=A0A2T1A1M2_9ACTN|nr:DUF1839 family protein [Antricoccus suffuscus]PRZ42509.1 uncharacterized protein DUF1839 [Antricoccus suffuscus]